MAEDGAVESAIDHYLGQVAAGLTDLQPRQRDTLLRELRDHIREAVRERAGAERPTVQDAYAALAEMAAPEEFAREAQHLPPRETQGNLAVLAVICALLQIGGLAAAVAGIPVLPGVSGFAAIVAFFLARSRPGTPRWVLRMSAFAAVCGVGLVVLDVARSM